MNINWYPGHMKKTIDELRKTIQQVDLVWELLDARIPYSSKNPVFPEIIGNKPRILLMNKADLADPNKTEEWIRFYNERNIHTLAINSKNKKSLNKLYELSKGITASKVEDNRKRGIKNTTIRFMIVGIPNVGKSTLINTILGKRQAKIGNLPGITKSNQWLKTRNGMELLDTPGVLWPKFETKKQGRLLAYTGAIKDHLLDMEDLAFYFLQDIYPMYSQLFIERYGITDHMGTLQMMDAIGEKTGKLIRGGDVDYIQVANIIFDDFRNGRIGPMTLEWAYE